MKKLLFIIFIFITCFKLALFAQGGVGFQQFSIGAGLGTTGIFANTISSENKIAGYLNLNFNITPFFLISLEGQTGTLAGNNPLDTTDRHFTNSFSAVILQSDIQLGEFIDYSRNPFLNSIKNIYFGTGIGVINNKITSIQSYIASPTGNIFLPYYLSNSNIVIPIRLGYDFKIFNTYGEPKFRFDISYTLTTALGDGLDGYLANAAYGLTNYKFYTYTSIGLKYCFGPTKLYRKPTAYTY